MKFIAFFCLIIGYSGLSIAQDGGEKVDSTRKMTNITVLPVVYLTPETGLAFGAGASLAIKPPAAIHTSNIRGGAVYTLRKQFLSFLAYQLFLKGDRYRLNGEMGFYDYVYEYYGIGNTPEEREIYDDTYFAFQITGTQKLSKGLYAGISSQWEWHDITNFEPVEATSSIVPTGFAGGTFGMIGPIIQWDTRDNVYWPSEGHYLESSIRWSNQTWGSDFDFVKWQFDFRKYFSIKKNVLAFQVFQETTTGEVPFYSLSLLGGSKKLRGYYEGYLRDQLYLSSQAEWRGHLFWRIGYTVFAGVGTTSPNWSSVINRQYWPSYGAGIRFATVPKEKINLRLDYAFGRGTSALYITFAEAF